MMKKNRQDGLYLLLLGCAAFLLFGIGMEIASPESMLDFKVVYYGARCTLQHSDPYKYGEILRIYLLDAGKLPSGPTDLRIFRDVMSMCIYPPTALFFVSPFALLTFGTAHVLWVSLLLGIFILASILIWDLGSEYDSVLAGILTSFLIANNVVVIAVGNTAALVISLCVISAWCFIRERFVWLGVLCLALSLGIKPHDSIWVWLALFLVGGRFRKPALKSMLAAVLVSLSAILWVSHVAPGWWREISSNVSALSAHGGLSDPSWASKGNHGIGMVMSLQSIFSAFSDDPRIYNSLSYLVCAPPMLLWVWTTFRSRSSLATLWLALAALIPLSMLPVNHRPYDAKLILLTIPACAMLWSYGARIGKTALWINSAAIVLTGDLPWLMLQLLVYKLHLEGAGMGQRVLNFMWVFPTPLILLAAGIFNLWVYMQYSSGRILAQGTNDDFGRPQHPELANA